MAQRHCELLCWGCGEFGQHGHGKVGDIRSDRSVLSTFSSEDSESENSVKFLACGSSHTVVVTKNDDIYTWGNGNSGQLGSGTKDTNWEPQRIQLHSNQDENPKIHGAACGGRHTFLWLSNGHMFSFGNNFFAQLGYDFRITNYKENQVKPHLLQTMTYRVVKQVACGEKHSLFLFEEGTIAAVGNNCSGQIGSGHREEAVVPKFIDEIPTIIYIACGSSHSLAIDENHEVWQWGYGKACGTRKNDLLHPTKCLTRRANIVMVAGGQGHSMALSANGNVYVWGNGDDGQLGLGENTRYASDPKPLHWLDLRCSVTYIGAGEAYSALITDMGDLYMCGKNSHLIDGDDMPNTRYFSPRKVELGDQRVRNIQCGAWHVAALTGVPDWEKCDERSDDDLTSEDECQASYHSSEESELEVGSEMHSRRWYREKTTLAEFYAPTPDIPCQSGSESPDIMDHKKTQASSSSNLFLSSNSLQPHSRHPPKSKSKRIPRSTSEINSKSECIPSDGDKVRNKNEIGTQCSLEEITEPIEKLESHDVPMVTINYKEKDGAEIDDSFMAIEGTNSSNNIEKGDELQNVATEVESSNQTLPDYAFAKGGVSFQIPSPVKLQPNNQRVLGSIPREKTIVPNKMFGFVDVQTNKPLESPQRWANSKQGAVNSRMNSGPSNPGNRDLKHGNNNTAMIALRRSQQLRTGASAVPEIKKSTAGYMEHHGNGDVSSASTNSPKKERSLSVPQTVQIIENSDNLPIYDKRQVSIPGKNFRRNNTSLSLLAEIPRTRAVFSSASSWKHEADRAKLKSDVLPNHPIVEVEQQEVRSYQVNGEAHDSFLSIGSKNSSPVRSAKTKSVDLLTKRKSGKQIHRSNSEGLNRVVTAPPPIFHTPPRS